MSVDSIAEIRNYEDLRAQQAGSCTPMTSYELISIRNGFPPIQSCVATPAQLRDDLSLGVVGVEEMPLSMAKACLEKIYGPQPPQLDLQATFTASAKSLAMESSPAPFPFLNGAPS